MERGASSPFGLTPELARLILSLAEDSNMVMPMTTSPPAPILQRTIPFDAALRALPGIRPIAPEDWVARDEAFEAQMAYRRKLLSTRRAEVVAMDDSARPAAEELLYATLDLLRGDPSRGYQVFADHVILPDGSSARLTWDDPMGTLCQLVQEDLCILQKQGAEHVLTAASLCFPSMWMLGEKMMRPLSTIHDPVDSYDDQIARRVQRLFDGVQVGKPLWRHNRLWHDNPDLFQPRSVMDTKEIAPEDRTGPYLRVEKQVILRLPKTQAVVFSIHTYVIDSAAP